MKTLTLIFGCLLLSVIFSSVFAEASTDRQAARKKQADHSVRLNTQKERLQDIRDIASGQRQDIEKHYLAALAQLKQEALQQARRIRPLERILWTEFIFKKCQKPYADIYFPYYAHLFIPDYPEAAELRCSMIDNYFLNTAADFLMDADARELLAGIVDCDTPRNSQNFLIREKAKELLTVMDYFAAMSENIESQKESELADLKFWEETLMAEVQRTVREMASPPKVTSYGTVIAVVKCDKGSFCMIEGIDEIFEVGDTISNAQVKDVKVIKMDTDKARVEFDRNGRQWAQTVGQTPNPKWK
jgi:hypothetical protein